MILQRSKRAMVITMCVIELVDMEIPKVVMQMLDLHEAIDQAANVNTVFLVWKHIGAPF